MCSQRSSGYKQHISITSQWPLRQVFNENEFIDLSSCDLGGAGCQGDIYISMLFPCWELIETWPLLLNTSLFTANSGAYVIELIGGGEKGGVG